MAPRSLFWHAPPLQAIVCTFLLLGRNQIVNIEKSVPVSCLQSAGVGTADPGGFTVVDVFAMGSAGHVIGAGIILGLQALN